MSHIILTDDQVDILRSASGVVLLRDSKGQCVGLCGQTGFTPEQIAEAEKRLDSDGPWRTTQEVLEHLGQLESP